MGGVTRVQWAKVSAAKPDDPSLIPVALFAKVGKVRMEVREAVMLTVSTLLFPIITGR